MSRGAERERASRIVQGDEAEGSRLVAEQYPAVRRFLHHLTGREEDAKDLAQQTFLEAWKSLPGYRGDSSLKTWLHRIAYHQYTRWLRSRRPCLPLDGLSLCTPGPEEGHGETLALRSALARLSPEHREAVLLHYVQEFTVREMAGILQLPGGTVKTRLHAARKRLRELLRDAPDGHEATTEAPEHETHMVPSHE